MWTTEQDQLSAVLEEGKFMLSFYNYGKLTGLYVWEGRYVEVFYSLVTSAPERMHIATDADMKKYLDRMEIPF